MQDRRHGARHVVSFPIRVKWKNDDGKVVEEEGLTENIGVNGALVYLPVCCRQSDVKSTSQ
jgi:hypothetical protein